METPTQPYLKKHYRDMDPEELEIALKENSQVLTEHFDMEYLRTLNKELIPFLDIYFRPAFIGFENIPLRSEVDAPLIFACNHSGMAFPWDAIVFGSGIFHRLKYDPGRIVRPLTAPMLSASSLMNPYLITDIWKRCGGLDATGLNFETAMTHAESHLLIYPEGVPGIGKGFNRRYQLQRFSTSFIRMALKYKTKIVGISCVNGEWINPFGYASRRLNKLVNKMGVPYLPVALQTPLLLIQPWLFYYALPAKLVYVEGRTFDPTEMTGGKAYEDLDPFDVARVRDKIQELMQEDLNAAVEAHGKHPYRLGELFKNIIKHWRTLPYWTPIGWPAVFTEFDRRFEAEGHETKDITKGWFRFWKIIWKNPIVLAYFIPIVGWIPILRKGLRDRKKVKPWEGSSL